VSQPPNDPAAEIAAAANAPMQAPDLTGGAQEDGGAAEAFDVKELPADCPVTPLGVNKQKMLYLDFMGQLIELGTECRKGELMALYGTRMPYLDAQWPQWKALPVKKGEPPQFEKNGFSQKDAQAAHIMACSKKGFFDRRDKERGRGAHRGDDGELVLHCGSAVLVGGRRGVKGRLLKEAMTPFKPGLVAGYVYPTLARLKRPDEEEPADDTIGKQILSCLATWNWKNRAVIEVAGVGTVPIAAYLLFCWIATALLGGALRIRPHGWIVGPSGAGKTTLQKFLQEIMGDWGVFTEDATEAGVRQLLDQDTLAVMFDEIEAEEDNRDTVMRIVRLARLAYSGASALRGSSDHNARVFVARSCFLFSSIHHHELPAQDRNRIAILQLSQFAKDKDGNEPAKFLVPPQTREWGDRLRRRLIDQWPRLDTTLGSYQGEMHRQGYSGREQDTYGTLLGCGDLLLHDDAPDPYALTESSDRVLKLVRAIGGLVDVARTEAEDTSERCIKHLASHRLTASGGQPQETVARWIQKLIIQIHQNNADRMGDLRQRLGSEGLRVVHLKDDHMSGNGQGGIVDAYVLKSSDGAKVPMWLAVANKTNQGAQDIFAGSMWQGGVWTQSLSLIPGSFHNKKVRFGANGKSEGCVLVPLGEVVDIDAAIEEAARLGS
jgi:hypothetical protein